MDSRVKGGTSWEECGEAVLVGLHGRREYGVENGLFLASTEAEVRHVGGVYGGRMDGE